MCEREEKIVFERVKKRKRRVDHHHTQTGFIIHSQSTTERTGSCLICSLERSMPGLARRISASSSLPKTLTGVTAALEGDLLVGVTEPGEWEGEERER